MARQSQRAFKLGYWKARGVAQPIRFLMKHTEMEFDDITYDDEESWEREKSSLDLDFPGIPYLIDVESSDKFTLTQSNAILRYIARKHDLCGKTDKQIAQIDMLENEATDFRNEFVDHCYFTDMDIEDPKKEYLIKAKKRLGKFNKFLNDNTFFAEEKSFVDFIIYELLFQHFLYDQRLLDEFQNLKTFMKEFEALQGIKEYLDSSEFPNYPVNTVTANWGTTAPSLKKT